MKSARVTMPTTRRARSTTGSALMRRSELDVHHGWPQRLHAMLRKSPASHSEKPEVVGQIMTRQVRVASAERPISQLVPLFAASGHHHIPIIDSEQRLVGMITQSDLVAAVCRTNP